MDTGRSTDSLGGLESGCSGVRLVKKSNTPGCWRHTLLLLLRALASDTAGHVIQERRSAANAMGVKAALLGECASSTRCL